MKSASLVSFLPYRSFLLCFVGATQWIRLQSVWNGKSIVICLPPPLSTSPSLKRLKEVYMNVRSLYTWPLCSFIRQKQKIKQITKLFNCIWHSLFPGTFNGMRGFAYLKQTIDAYTTQNTCDIHLNIYRLPYTHEIPFSLWFDFVWIDLYIYRRIEQYFISYMRVYVQRPWMDGGIIFNFRRP